MLIRGKDPGRVFIGPIPLIIGEVIVNGYISVITTRRFIMKRLGKRAVIELLSYGFYSVVKDVAKINKIERDLDCYINTSISNIDMLDIIFDEVCKLVMSPEDFELLKKSYSILELEKYD